MYMSNMLVHMHTHACAHAFTHITHTHTHTHVHAHISCAVMMSYTHCARAAGFLDWQFSLFCYTCTFMHLHTHTHIHTLTHTHTLFYQLFLLYFTCYGLMMCMVSVLFQQIHATEKDIVSASSLLSVGADFAAAACSEYTRLLFLLSRGMVRIWFGVEIQRERERECVCVCVCVCVCLFVCVMLPCKVIIVTIVMMNVEAWRGGGWRVVLVEDGSGELTVKMCVCVCVCLCVSVCVLLPYEAIIMTLVMMNLEVWRAVLEEDGSEEQMRKIHPSKSIVLTWVCMERMSTYM